MHIRPESAADVSTIHALTESAFAPMAFSDGSEPAVVDRLRADGNLTLSLVAEDPSGEVVGHIAFSPVVAGEVSADWYGLGPISVAPDRQGQGIGRALIEAGLEALRQRHAAGCALIGDPLLYSRFGFRSGALTYGGIDNAFTQYLALDDSPAPVGELRFAKAFDSDPG